MALSNVPTSIPTIIEIPESFRRKPRWWRSDQGWLDRLAEAINLQCQRWNLQPDGSLLHGSNAVVLPVLHAGLPYVLRMTPPGDAFDKEEIALRFWDGRGTVKLIDVDLTAGAMLLERLETSTTLADLPLEEAVPVIARLMRKLALPLQSDDIPSTAEIVSTRLSQFPTQWDELGRPFSKELLQQVIQLTSSLHSSDASLSVNGDLHYAQVLAGKREAWLMVDPILLRGDIEYDLARLLWTRLNEMADDEEIIFHFETAVREADLDPCRAWRWVSFPKHGLLALGP